MDSEICGFNDKDVSALVPLTRSWDDPPPFADRRGGTGWKHRLIREA